MNSFLKDTGIEIDFDLPQSVWLQARRRLARYAQRCRVTVAGLPKRLLADFVIGSHALTEADHFITLDPLRYKRDFPELTLI